MSRIYWTKIPHAITEDILAVGMQGNELDR